MTCPVCQYPLIPGIADCVNCGAPPEDVVCALEGGDGASAEQVAQWRAENTEARRLQRRLTEARALEAATDADGAIAIYEALVREGTWWPDPYKRLAILYHKRKDAAAEERVVRAALGHIGDARNGWFIVRLAKILARHRRAL